MFEVRAFFVLRLDLEGRVYGVGVCRWSREGGYSACFIVYLRVYKIRIWERIFFRYFVSRRIRFRVVCEMMKRYCSVGMRVFVFFFVVYGEKIL